MKAKDQLSLVRDQLGANLFPRDFYDWGCGCRARWQGARNMVALYSGYSLVSSHLPLIIRPSQSCHWCRHWCKEASAGSVPTSRGFSQACEREGDGRVTAWHSTPPAAHQQLFIFSSMQACMSACERVSAAGKLAHRRNINGRKLALTPRMPGIS